MKVNIANSDNKKMFNDIHMGEVFITLDGNNIYMRTNSNSKEEGNCVNLETGTLGYCYDSQMFRVPSNVEVNVTM